MINAAYILTVIAITLLFAPSAKAASSKVYINNNVNTGYDSYSSSQTNTRVEIHQEGEGTTSVKINGKEWKLEGPGNISEEEYYDSDNSATNDDTSSPTQESVEPTQTPSETSSPTPTGEDSAEVLGDSDENNSSFADALNNLISEFLVSIQNLFFKTFAR
jgi:hypothetical protein